MTKQKKVTVFYTEYNSRLQMKKTGREPYGFLQRWQTLGIGQGSRKASSEQEEATASAIAS